MEKGAEIQPRSTLVNFIITSSLAVIPFVLLTLSVTAWRDAFEFDTDEGINLIKAALIMEDFLLYERVWSDQPPLFTLVLSMLFSLTASSVEYARMLVLGFSVCLIAALAWFCYRSVGLISVVLLPLMLLASPHFLQLSVSVMIGLPALCLALVSLILVWSYLEARRQVAIVFSALTMGLALAAKMFVAPIAAIIFCYFIILGLKRKDNALIKSGVWWLLGTLLALSAVIVPLTDGGQHISQLFGSHIAARGYSRSFLPGLFPVLEMIAETFFLLVLSVVSVYLLPHNHGVRLLAAVMCVYFLILVNHSPVWYHHVLLLSVPASCLSAIACGQIIKFRIWQDIWDRFKYQKPGRWILSITTLLILSLSLLNGVIDAIATANRGKCAGCEEIIQRLHITCASLDSSCTMVTDRPMFAFRSGISVIPELAVFSRKRSRIEGFTARYISALINEQAPDIILTGRSKWSEKLLMEAATNEYEQIFDKRIASDPYSDQLFKTRILSLVP